MKPKVAPPSRVAVIPRPSPDPVLDVIRVAGVLAILAAAASIAAAQSPTLETPATLPLQASLSRPVLADLDGDGFQEAIATTGAPTRLVVLRGRSTGFGPPVDLDAGGTPRSQARVADFDGDARPDLLVALQDERFAVLLGGDAGFEDPILTATGFGLVTGMRVADFDEDGRMDVVASFSLAEKVAVYLGDGAGGLTLVSSIDIPVRPGALAVDHLDDDEHLDVVIGALGTTRIAFGDGTGGFRSVFRFDNVSHVRGAGTGDFDGDGNRDFLVINDTPGDARLTTGYGDGTGAFELRTTPAQRELTTLEVGSLDGDARTDAVTVHVDRTSSFRTVTTWHGTADRTLTPEIVTGLTDSAIGALSASLGDTDTDGRLDLVVPHYLGSDYRISTIPGDPSGRFRYVRSAATSRTVRALGQLDRDGLLDLAATDVGSLAILRGDGFGGFVERALFSVPRGTNRVSIADVDGDGASDIVASSPESTDATLLLSDGADGWLPPAALPLPIEPREIATGDVDHDGLVDLAALGSADGEPYGVRILKGDGAGGFTEIQNIGLSGSAFETVSISIHEMNGDAFVDLVVVTGENFRVFLGDGSGSFSLSDAQALARIHDVAIVDLEPDGFHDLVFIHGNARQLGLYRGAADGTFRNPYTAPDVLPLQSKLLAIGDIDGDGRGDLVTKGERGTIAVLPGSGGGSFLFASEFLAPPGNADIFIGDFGFDGRPDLVLSNGSVIENTTFELIDCRTGFVGRGESSSAEDVLLVNGTAGIGAERVVSLAPSDSIEIRMDAPSSIPSGPSRFALYLYADAPDETTVTLAPLGLGTSCFPTPISRRGPLPDVVWNNTGKALLGTATKPSAPAPSIVISVPGGVGRPIRAFLQGLIADDAAPNGRGAVTNAVEVRVE